MKIKSLFLRNIRSYEEEQIEFEEGSILLAGDVGSGKTSILLAIEFALFGLQPGQRGHFLLRNGALNGGVKLELSVEGKTILIERELKRGSKSISQDYASITIDGEKQEMSVSELKNKVLKILNYPKEFLKKQNILYKFTVYTPQEEMKRIILQDPDTRVNTLRYIFGIDKYKRIIENASILVSKVRKDKRINEGMISSLQEEKSKKESKINLLESKKQDLVIAEKEFSEKSKLKINSQKELEEISKKRDEKQKIENEIEKTKMMISTKNSSINDNKKLIEKLEEQIKELEKSSFDFSKIEQVENEKKLIENEKKRLEEQIVEIRSNISSLNLKNQENQKIDDKLKYIEVCPTCLQDVNENYKNNVLKKLKRDTLKNTQEIEEMISKKNEIQEEILKKEKEISLKQKKVQELSLLKAKIQSLEEKQERVSEIRNFNNSLNKDLNMLSEQLGVLKDSLFELKKYEPIIQEKQKNLEKAQNEEKKAEIKVAELKKEISFFDIQIQEIKKKIQELEGIREKLNYLANLEEWLSGQFIPLLSNVEKNVMNKLRTEFSQLFSEWFSMLVPDTFNTSLDENFTPIIGYKDYEIDYAYLSGGERTSVALAYRLALNQIINSLLSKINTKGIVILDEPTDGFSDTQLDRMRNVLEELNVAQLIIVSHEQKIEGFVDNVIKFKKENGISQKEVVKRS